jgi:beta-lactamase class A
LRKAPVAAVLIVLLTLLPLSLQASDKAAKRTDKQPAPRPEPQKPEPPKVDRREMTTNLRRIVDESPGEYGLYLHETDTARDFEINGDAQFRAASTIKVLILALLYREIEAGNIGKRDRWRYTGSDREGGTGSIQNSPIGSDYSVKELASRMMKESDNVAANIMIRMLGWQNLRAFADELALPGVQVNGNQATARGMSLLMLKIYNHEIVGPELSQEMMGLMTDTYLETRIPGRLPDKVSVAHKTGDWQGTTSDVGIVFGPDRPFIISIFVRNHLSDEQANETMAKITKEVYAFKKRQAGISGR